MSNFRRKVWNPAVCAARLDGVTPHGLRDTTASLYISAGTPPKVVQRILGHGSIAITLDLYGHLYPDEMDTWATSLGESPSACGQNVATTTKTRLASPRKRPG
jgi:integrase